MKAKLLLCMLALGLLAATAQPPTPRVLEKNYRVTPTSQSLTSKFLNGNDSSTPSLLSNDFKSDKVNINHIKPFDCKKTIAAGTPTQQVNLFLDFDNTTQPIAHLYMINWIDEFDLSWDWADLSQGLNNLDIPTGTYDIIAEFWQYPIDYEAAISQGLSPEKLLFVIREKVVIDQDMQIDIAASDAKNHIQLQTLTIDGEPVSLGKWFVDENWHFEEVEPANVVGFDYTNYLYCSDYGPYIYWMGNFSAIFEGAIQQGSSEQLADFYVSDVSPRFAFYSYRVFSKDNGIFTTAYETMGASKDTTINNDPAKYTLFEDPFTNERRHQNEERFLSYTFSVQHPEVIYGYQYQMRTNIVPLLPLESIKTYIGTDIDYSQAGFYPFIETAASIRTANDIFQPLTIAKPYKKDGEIKFDNTGSTFYDMTYTATQHFRNDFSNDPPTFYPIMLPPPDYSFSADKKRDILGNSCPLLTSNPMHYFARTDNGQYFELEFLLDYTGRYGELIVDDAVNAQINFKLNDEELLNIQGSFIAVGPEPIVGPGVVDVDIINEGFLIDNIAGSNKAQLHYTSGADDENPPTTTMLLFKSNDGDVTERFATAEEGMLEFTAGDFNESGNRIFDDRQAPESVDVSYSPYGEDNWNELAVEEVPENYWPVMGWFYTGSLAGVTGEGLNGWFDLKIRLTDAAGNWQEQVISPAFRIDDLAYSSVATITPSNKGDNTIYNLAGQRMRGDLESLPHGVYIVSGKKVVK